MTEDRLAKWLDRFGVSDQQMVEQAERLAIRDTRRGGRAGDLYAEQEERYDPFEAVAFDDPDDLDWTPEPVRQAPARPAVEPSNYRAAIRARRARRAA